MAKNILSVLQWKTFFCESITVSITCISFLKRLDFLFVLLATVTQLTQSSAQRSLVLLLKRSHLLFWCCYCGIYCEWSWILICSFLLLHASAATAVVCLSHRNSVRPSICLSVCLSHGWISQKRCKLGSLDLHRWLPGRL